MVLKAIRRKHDPSSEKEMKVIKTDENRTQNKNRTDQKQIKKRTDQNRNREEKKTFRGERRKRRTGKDITRSEDRTEEQIRIHYSPTLFSKFHSKEKEKKETKKKLSDVAAVCTISKICARVNQPQET